jgi:hypothetical protein
MPNAQVLQGDLHGFAGTERKGLLTRARRVQVNRATSGARRFQPRND